MGELRKPGTRAKIRGSQRLVSAVNICSVEGNSARIYGSKLFLRGFVIKEK